MRLEVTRRGQQSCLSEAMEPSRDRAAFCATVSLLRSSWVLALDSHEPLFTVEAPFVKLAFTATTRAVTGTGEKEQGILKQHPKTTNLESKKAKEGNQSSHSGF